MTTTSKKRGASKTREPEAAALSRRQFLAVSAGSTLAVAAPGARAASEKRSSDTDFDAIVIGGGFAGSVAARELGADGRRVLVLEARPRLGGRTFTSRFMDHDVEFGGAWVHWLQPHVWPELLRYGRGIVEDPLTNLDRSIVMFNDGKTKEFEPLAFDQSFQDAFEKFNRDARELFPRPYDPTFNPKTLEVDKKSAADRIDELDLTEVQVAQLRGMLALYAGGLTREYGVPGIVKCYACLGWNYGAFMDAETHYRIEGGTIGLIEDLLKDSGAEVRTGTPVTAIQQSKEMVKVTTEDDETFSARTCVVTVPLNTLSAIQFSPELSKEKQALVKEGQLSSGAKLYVHVKEDLGRVFAFSDEEQPLNWVQTHANGPDLGTILSITIARVSTLNVSDPDQVRAAVRALIPGAEVTASAAYDWARDPFSRGAWPAYRVGQFSRIGALRETEGRLVFGGAATASGLHEYIDGAVESGLRAGRDARAILD